MANDDDAHGWAEYRRLVMDSIQRLAQEIRHERNNAKQVQRDLVDRLIDVEKEIATLKVRCGIWGLMGGLIPAVTALILTRV